MNYLIFVRILTARSSQLGNPKLTKRKERRSLPMR